MTTYLVTFKSGVHTIIKAQHYSERDGVVQFWGATVPFSTYSASVIASIQELGEDGHEVATKPPTIPIPEWLYRM